MNKLLYFTDPLCSWCYGFSGEITKAKDHFPDLEFELVLGGLRPYGTETMKELASMLRHHWEEVHQRSGVEFSFDMLQKDPFIYDTEPPSRAVIAVRSLAPNQAFAFFKAVQRVFYAESADTGDPETYLPLLKDISAREFLAAFESDAIKQQTRDGFTYAQRLGVRGFPTTVLQQGDELHLIANGYTEAETVIKGVEYLLNKTES